MASRIVSLPIDCTDAELLASFWAEVLGWHIIARGWQESEHGPDGVSIGPRRLIGWWPVVRPVMVAGWSPAQPGSSPPLERTTQPMAQTTRM